MWSLRFYMTKLYSFWGRVDFGPSWLGDGATGELSWSRVHVSLLPSSPNCQKKNPWLAGPVRGCCNRHIAYAQGLISQFVRWIQLSAWEAERDRVEALRCHTRCGQRTGSMDKLLRKSICTRHCCWRTATDRQTALTGCQDCRYDNNMKQKLFVADMSDFLVHEYAYVPIRW